MPACAAFIKTTMLDSVYFASLRSRFTALKTGYKSRIGFDFKLNSNNSHSIPAQGLESEVSNYIRLENQAKFDDTFGFCQNSHIANYTIEVSFEHNPADVEMGVIKKSVSRNVSYESRAS